MRDLANQDFSNSNPVSSSVIHPKGKILIPRGAVKVVAVLAVVLVTLFIIKNLVTSGSLVGGSSIVLRDAPKGLIPVTADTGGDFSGDALNLAIESASFINVSGGDGSATATRKYGDGLFTMTVNASLPFAEGDTYQVWIVGGSVLKLAGTLEGSPSSLSLVFNDVDNYSKTNEIWITREITSDEGKPERHILEGTF